MGLLEVTEVSKRYEINGQRAVCALDHLSMTVENGQFVTILGSSGCGKSTLLRVIAGLEVPTSGIVRFEGREVTEPSRDRGLVFQAYGSFPWLSAVENVEFGLRHCGITRRQRQREAEDILSLVGLSDFSKSLPHTLSGGMQQRLALARSLALKPKLLLLDEPLASVDAINRKHLQSSVRSIVNALGITTILVTHDVEEAILLSDRILILTGGPGKIRLESKHPLLSIKPVSRFRESSDFQLLRKELTSLLETPSPVGLP